MSTLFQARNLGKTFALAPSPPEQRFGPRQPRALRAVDDVSFSLQPGQAIGLVGESGCGKSTLALLLARLMDVSEGTIQLDGRDLSSVSVKTFARDRDRRRIQMVFQDATDSLNPRDTVYQSIADPVRRLMPDISRADVDGLVRQTAERVNIPPELLFRFPHQLSGGQRARVGIARAISVSPDVLILDEPTSALDVSVQVVVLKLLARLRDELGMAYVFVSHDLNVVRMLCDRVLVMYLGRLIEDGPVSEVFRAPRHPYTAALIDAIPQVGHTGRDREALRGEPQSPVNPSPTICRLVGRCSHERDACSAAMPELTPADADHRAACFFPVN